MYHDAYTLQRVEADNLRNFNFVSGMVPFILNLILDVSTFLLYRPKFKHKFVKCCHIPYRHCNLPSMGNPSTIFLFQRKEGKILNSKKAHRLCQALDEVGAFMKVNGIPTKERQKLMRNLRVSLFCVEIRKYGLLSVLYSYYLCNDDSSMCTCICHITDAFTHTCMYYRE